VANELDDVDGGAEPAQVVEVLAEAVPGGGRLAADAADPVAHRLLHAGGDGARREAAHADHFCGHALAHLGFGGGTRFVHEIGVRVAVDEPWGHHQPRGVDHAGSFAGECAADGGDPIALHRHVSAHAGGAAAVDHGAALDEE